LEDSLASNLTETFDVVRTGVKRSAEIYINLCTLLERLTKRNEGLAADQLRFSLALKSLTEAVKAAYAVDTSDVPLLNEGIRATARFSSSAFFHLWKHVRCRQLVPASGRSDCSILGKARE